MGRKYIQRKFIEKESGQPVAKTEDAPFLLSVLILTFKTVLGILYLFMCFFDLKYKEDAFIFMLFYFFLLLSIGRLETLLKECIRHKTKMCTLAIYLYFLLLYSLDLIYYFGLHKLLFLGFALFYVCTYFVFNVYRLF